MKLAGMLQAIRDVDEEEEQAEEDSAEMPHRDEGKREGGKVWPQC